MSFPELTVMDVAKRPREEDTANSCHRREDERHALARNGVLAHHLPAGRAQGPPQRHPCTLITSHSANPSSRNNLFGRV